MHSARHTCLERVAVVRVRPGLEGGHIRRSRIGEVRLPTGGRQEAPRSGLRVAAVVQLDRDGVGSAGGVQLRLEVRGEYR